MIPVDLTHLDALDRALQTGADLARHYGATVTYVGVTGVQPSKVAHSPEEYAQKLDAFAARQGEAAGIAAQAKTIVAHDPSVDMDHMLLDAAEEIGADLVVMATHEPHAFDWPHHGGKLANHAKCSVMLVRNP
jgi:nucleotide-binding universal stress UspA family protein